VVMAIPPSAVVMAFPPSAVVMALFHSTYFLIPAVQW
jgi:hypothetical protein